MEFSYVCGIIDFVLIGFSSPSTLYFFIPFLSQNSSPYVFMSHVFLSPSLCPFPKIPLSSLTCSCKFHDLCHRFCLPCSSFPRCLHFPLSHFVLEMQFFSSIQRSTELPFCFQHGCGEGMAHTRQVNPAGWSWSYRPRSAVHLGTGNQNLVLCKSSWSSSPGSARSASVLSVLV